MQRAKKLICALDTSSPEQASKLVKKLAPYVGAFKIGHALTLNSGLDVISHLQDSGADRIFLDLKFHDIPNSVAIAVREAARRSVWMTTVHLSGGSAMLAAAVEEAHAGEEPVLLMGVSVLTSIDEKTLRGEIGVEHSVPDQMIRLTKLADACDLDGVISSPNEIKILRGVLGPSKIIASPGIRAPGGAAHDQKRIGTAAQALADGADYLVVGRAITQADDPEEAIAGLGMSAASCP